MGEPYTYARNWNANAPITVLNRSLPTDSSMSLDADASARHTDTMIEIGDTSVHLTRVDPDQNMARFYEMSVQPTLFGEATVFRNWGRIGTRGQSMMVTYPEANEAAAALAKLGGQKQRRGYR